MNAYRCPLCHKEVERNSNLYWIRTYQDPRPNDRWIEY